MHAELSGARAAEGTMRTAITNLSSILTGDLAQPTVSGDTIVMDGGRIVAISSGGAEKVTG